MIRPAQRASNVRYAIRNIVVEAQKLEAEGRTVLYCNIGDPLKFDFTTPPHLTEAVERAMRDGHNGYAPSAGILEARAAIAREWERHGVAVSPNDVMVTAGASEALELCLTALLDPGDGLLLPSPGYPLYNAIAAKLSAEVIPYHLDEAHGWSIDVDALEKSITPRTRAIVIGNPNNPTGAVLERKVLEGMLEVARRHDLVVFSDEIYDKLLYDRAHLPTAALARDIPIITFNGLSKSYIACGWRIGWAVFHNTQLTADLRAATLRLADARLCAPAPQQYAIAPALEGPQGHITEMMAKLRRRRDLMVRKVNAIPGLSVVQPDGAFYGMPRIQLPGVTSDEQFVIELLRETGVLFVHGSGFGQPPGTLHFRIVFLPTEAVLEEAFDRLAGFVAKRYS